MLNSYVIIWCTFPTTNIAPNRKVVSQALFFQVSTLVQQGVMPGNLPWGDVVAALREVGILEEQHGEIPELPGEAE